MSESRPEWSEDMKCWIISLIDFSLRESVAEYDDCWWRKKNGIPTGGSLCVQLANITVFYIMSKKVYNVRNMMTNVKDVKRFIDDGGGFYFGSEEEFMVWLDVVNREIASYGLHIDEWSFRGNSIYINLLDINYCFDENGKLQTDLYVKETDSRAYLNFSSAHFNHTFSGNVYSQSLRLRRIINSDERLPKRLAEVSKSFKAAGYPDKMVMEITNKVQASRRDISIKEEQDLPDTEQIIVVSTYDADQNIVEAVKDSEEVFKRTQSFRK